MRVCLLSLRQASMGWLKLNERRKWFGGFLSSLPSAFGKSHYQRMDSYQWDYCHQTIDAAYEDDGYYFSKYGYIGLGLPEQVLRILGMKKRAWDDEC